MSGTSLPEWQSHKKVLGDRIEREEVKGLALEGRVRHQWFLRCGAIIDASDELQRRVPATVSPIGGYYVRYEDGFESWSPAKAFEEGYTKVEG